MRSLSEVPSLLVTTRLFVVRGVFVRRPATALLTHGTRGLMAEPEHSEDEPLHAVRRLARPCPPRFGLVTVSDADSVGLIGVSHPTAHARSLPGLEQAATERRPVRVASARVEDVPNLFSS